MMMMSSRSIDETAGKAEPFSLSPISDSDQPEDDEDVAALEEEGLVEVIVIVPLSCIALLIYPAEPEPVGLTDSPKIDDGHLGRIAMSLTDLSLIYQEAGADMSEYDDDDIREQQKLQKTRSKLLEDLETVNAALAEARHVAANAQDHRLAASPARPVAPALQSAAQHDPNGIPVSEEEGGSGSLMSDPGDLGLRPAEPISPLSTPRTSLRSLVDLGLDGEPLPEGWQGVTVSIGQVHYADLDSSYGAQPHVVYELIFSVDGVAAFSWQKRYSQMKEIHDTMEAAGCFGWHGAAPPEFAPMHLFSDMVTDADNVRLRGEELRDYFQELISDEGIMTHPITARHLTFDGEVVHELRLERQEGVRAAEEARVREEKRLEDGRSHCRVMSDFCSATVFSHHRGVAVTHCVSRAADAGVRLAQRNYTDAGS